MAFTGIGKLLKDFVVNTLTTNNKTIPGAINELNENTITIKSESPWTTIEYPNKLIMSWRYATISSASGEKTNTLGLQAR